MYHRVDRVFLSTLSLRRATCQWPKHQTQTQNFYPRSPCGERPAVTRVARTPTTVISIHALLAESDARKNLKCPCLPISIHALLAESDGVLAHHARKIIKFLSTLSLRRATCRVKTSENQYRHFYPRSPCGERHLGAWKPCDVCHFYPRSPCGERPVSALLELIPLTISIHALLAESDSQQPDGTTKTT